MAATGNSMTRRQLLDKLYRPATLLGRRNFDAAVLAELARLGDPSVIPYLTPILFSKSQRDVAEVARVVNTLLDAATLGDLARLDMAMRSSWYWGANDYNLWRRVEPHELRKWVGPDEPGVLLLRLSSFHPNGFVREEAIRRLGLIRDGTELPYLLIRMADWVPQVRTLANALVAERTRADYARHFVDNLELLYRLSARERSGSSDVLGAAVRLLASEEARPAMIAAMDVNSGAVRRWALTCLAGLPQPELVDYLLGVMHNDDPIVRAMALERIREVVSGAQLRAVLESLERDPTGLVRREVLRTRVSSFPDASAYLERALMDRSRAVREEARYWLGQWGTREFAQYYRDQLENENAGLRFVAIAGLGETGGPHDASRLIPYLVDPAPRVRRASVSAVAALDADGNLDRLLQMVGDPSPSVSRQAVRAIGHKAARFDAELLWPMVEFGEPHARRNAVRLIAMTSKWDSIGYLLRIAGSHEDDLAVIAQALIGRWVSTYNRSWATPSSVQLNRIRSALPCARGIAQLVRYISSALDRFDVGREEGKDSREEGS